MKAEKCKPKLTISIPHSDKKQDSQSSESQEIYVKPIYSVKNINKRSIKFNFYQEKIEETTKDRQGKRFEREKDLLLSSLGALKGGAISAIAEKQEQIDQLRSQLGWSEVQQLEEDVRKLLKERKQLKEQIEELEEKLVSERQSYVRMLEQKDRVIEELYVELGSMQIENEKLQKYEEMKQKKIKIIEEQNNCLFHQLEQQKKAHLRQNYQTVEKAISPPTQESLAADYQDEALAKEFNESVPQQSINLKQIQMNHKEQLNELTLFYEKRIAEMRQIYEKELSIWPQEQSKQSSLRNQMREEVISLIGTIVPVQNLLSSQLNMKKLSDCYSMTKRDFSKMDKQSMNASEKDMIDFNFKFLKRVCNTPVSQTTTSLRAENSFKFMITQPKRHNQSQTTVEKREEVQPIKEQKQTSPFVSFMFGAITGSAFITLINLFSRK